MSDPAPPRSFDNLRAANLARCALWRPGGVTHWSPSDWFTAMAGEIGELLAAGAPAAEADETADVLIYLDLLLARLGLDFPERMLYGGDEADEAALRAATALLLIGDRVKKLNRSRDGLTGNRVDDAALLSGIRSLAGDARDLLMCRAHVKGVDLPGAIERKFNAVSARNGFPVRLALAGAEAEAPAR